MSTAAQSSYAASTADNANNVAAVFLPRPRSRLRTIAKQYDEAAQQTVTHTDEPYKIVWGSRTFVISGVLNKKKSRGRRFLDYSSHNIAEDSPSRPDNEMTGTTTHASRPIYRSLDPTITDRDIKARRMRCFGHVLNLVVQAFLFGQDATCFERDAYTLSLWSDDEAELAHWRAKGPVGKLHNIVKFIRASPQRSEAFRQHAKEAQTSDDYLLSEEPTWDLGLKQDNSTRWNSTYLMIERAVRKRDDINSFILELDLESDGDKRIPDADKLTTDDWKALIEIRRS
ncbi:hypothetical protein CHGG_00189 [Chaetomium globosum CBS 148.51]|uniref:HAT C-terminal dimerisation domain-containing protein n=1 Tax=Chaetomium globosum (strain ATCC 6205 / CBS 148.51 / DSM 1962 / NBRC 6347 / NRRL 1970) TaxID=306901 RepID=Q2HHW5_CHAGB|nr:uncharacterized protein CHGG_00189 [Chaetomium globosum CBS 148.51]EAQ91954.1 hypothetical protein CHGG_00189 [Chaetomium globosum CBS 148.51]